MGCLHSKKETSDLHPNVFRVVNIDENGLDLCSGQLEITESDIILYREGRDSTVWPLHSLRRYGFEGEIFSFESGRRCETGEGIYAFRCRRASLLFRTLQQQIQLRNVIHDSVPYPVSRLTPSPQGRQTLQASVVHRSSIDNGLPDNAGPAHNNNLQNAATHTGVAHTVAQSPRSPSSADILEVMPLYPRSQTNTNHVTNVYQLRDFKREHNNNQSEANSDPRHVYCNDLNRDLAILRNTLRQETALNTMRDIEDETRFLESRYLNDCISNNVNTLSPTLSNSSEHYAQLSLEQQEAARLYMNIAPPDKNSPLSDVNKNEAQPTTPLTPKQVEYCNLSVGVRAEPNTYANLSLGEVADTVKNAKQMLHFNAPEHSQKFSESDTFTSMSPVEELEVNYAVLDIENNKETLKMTRELASPESQSYNSSKNESTASCSSQGRGRLVSQSSLEKAPPAAPQPAPQSAPQPAPAAPQPAPASVGYTTIDFDKTVALTSVAAGFIVAVSETVKIEDLIVPELVQLGNSTEVTLDCRYSGVSDKFTIQWLFNGNSSPVYEWSPRTEPRVSGILEGRLDLKYKVSSLLSEEKRALRIVALGPQLSGQFTCKVIDQGAEAQQSNNMLVFSTEREFLLQFVRRNNYVEIKCSAKGLYPQPDLIIEQNGKMLAKQQQRVWHTEALLYDIESTVCLFEGTTSHVTVEQITCRLQLPQAGYTAIKKDTLYLGKECKTNSSQLTVPAIWLAWTCSVLNLYIVIQKTKTTC